MNFSKKIAIKLSAVALMGVLAFNNMGAGVLKDVVILDNGEEIVSTTQNTTVRDILSEQGFIIDTIDYTYPDLDSEISESNGTVIINRKYTDVVYNNSEIPFETEVRENKDLEPGTEKVIQEGKNGLKKQTVGVYSNNPLGTEKDIEYRVIREELVYAPVNEIKEVGPEVKTAQVVKTNHGKVEVEEDNNGKTINGMKVKKVIEMNGSAYSYGACNGQWGNVTAMGTKLRPGVVAVDKRVIPLGSKLYIESMDGFASYGMAVAEDTGGAIKGNKIDLFYEDYNYCLKFGRRPVRVYVLEDN